VPTLSLACHIGLSSLIGIGVLAMHALLRRNPCGQLTLFDLVAQTGAKKTPNEDHSRTGTGNGRQRALPDPATFGQRVRAI